MHWARLTNLLLLIFLIGAWIAAAAADPVVSIRPEPDYAKPEVWLCRPGQKDVCRANYDATEVKSDGSLGVEHWKENIDAPIDCFYVYPTISYDKLPNSDLMTNPYEEDLVARDQFGRFAAVCRLYAPIYRQGTIPALVGLAPAADFELAYGDVARAFRYYLEHWNDGRGFVLVGHSQGSRMLKTLVQREIEGKPLQKQLVSAIIPGTNVAVPNGQDIGGDFKSVPPCRSATQTGCLVSYVTFRKTAPPPENSRFGRPPGPGLSVACADPAALVGDRFLKPYFASNHRDIVWSPTAPIPRPWISPWDEGIETPYVTLPEFLTATCVNDEHGSYLEVTAHPDEGSRRTKDIGEELYRDRKVLQDWGLHLIDINIAQGNLLELVKRQSAAYLR